MTLPRYLAELQREIEGYAREFELDYFDVIFEMLPYDAINMVAAYGGFPTRYPHWRFGMEYEQLKQSYRYGLSKIYEMVINNDPCYAYLLEGNSLVEQKIVMAHVYAHCDFFKNNYYFRDTNRKMMNEMANHATRIRRYMSKFGVDQVENFIDACLSLENLIDPHAPMIRQRTKTPPVEDEDGERPGSDSGVPKLRVDRKYLETYINPAEYIEKQKKKLAETRKKAVRFPPHPERDVLLFLMEHAPMKRHERDVMGIIREEAYYFLPQGQTKIMNEGWASYWHSTIMTQRALTDGEVIDFADSHSATMGGGSRRLNPYKLGLELFRSIEERWNTGRFGKEYNECTDRERKQRWNKHLNQGREKIFQVRKLHNDVTFIDEFLDEDFCYEKKLFGFDYNRGHSRWEISSREFKAVKAKLLFSLTNHGQPVVEVVDSNHANRGELLLAHRHEGIDLDMRWAQPTMEALQRIWKRPVLLRTTIEEKPFALRYDGQDHSMEKVADMQELDPEKKEEQPEED